MQVPISDIKIGDRYRKDMGDIEGLARSMNEIGLLHPVALDADYRLIAGERRILAARLLGWERIEAHFVDLENLLQGEQDENKVRKDFTVTEAVAIASAVKAREAEKARQRQEESRANRGVNFTPRSEEETGKTRDKVAQAVGMSWPTLEKAREVVEAAEKEPELFGPIAEEMDRTGKVAPAFDKLEKARNVHFMSDSIECYTPSEILARAVRAMGAIDLDPCSNSHESPNVPAAQHYTQEDDGLAQAWAGRVFMNPPYGRELDDWIAKLCEEYEGGHVSQAIALVPSRTDTQWFRRLRAYPRCFIWGRLRFVNQENSAPFPSMAVYLGGNLGAFLTSFSDIGDTYTLTNDDNIPV